MGDATVRRLRAAAHPLRLRMLSLLTGAELSAAEVARELDISHANASYHLRRLLEAGEVEVAGEESIRGGRAKRYRHPWREISDRRGPGEPDEVAAHVRAMAGELVRRHESREPGTPQHLADAELWVAPESWDEVREMLDRAARLLHEQARPPRTPGTRPVALTMATFALDPDA